MKVKVEGAAAKIDAIFRFDKELWRSMQREIKATTEVVATDARGRVPSQGLFSSRGSGWGRWMSGSRDLSFQQTTVRGGIKSRTRSRSKAGFRQVSGRVDMTSAAGAIFTLAGSRNQSGHPFNASINRQQGGSTSARGNSTWPRLLTPARVAKGAEASRKIAQIVEQGVRNINQA